MLEKSPNNFKVTGANPSFLPSRAAALGPRAGRGDSITPWQMAQQIKHELAQVAWPGGARDVVFGSRGVFVYAGAPPSDEEHPPGFPFALVTIGGGSPDDDDLEVDGGPDDEPTMQEPSLRMVALGSKLTAPGQVHP